MTMVQEPTANRINESLIDNIRKSKVVNEEYVN